VPVFIFNDLGQENGEKILRLVFAGITEGVRQRTFSTNRQTRLEVVE
jgi:hypothetical protein